MEVKPWLIRNMMTSCFLAKNNTRWSKFTRSLIYVINNLYKLDASHKETTEAVNKYTTVKIR